MGRVKDIKLKPISSKSANKVIKKLHYSGKVVPNSQVHFGVFLDGKCGGAIQYGPSLNKKGTIKIVKNTKWNDFIELNRFATADWMPKNTESRALAVSFKLLKKHYPNLEWIVSFADATQCGDGTIYRASGFILTAIKKNSSLWENKKTGKKRQDMQFYHTMTNHLKKKDNWQRLKGYQLRYIKFLNKDARKRLAVPEIPYEKIDEIGAGMYKGEKVTYKERNKG